VDAARPCLDDLYGGLLEPLEVNRKMNRSSRIRLSAGTAGYCGGYDYEFGYFPRRLNIRWRRRVQLTSTAQLHQRFARRELFPVFAEI
jgi:hypothetical protein